MSENLDCVVVGAGVVGLAIGRALAIAGREVIVIESESQVGMHTSSRNSEVIHAGIYYPAGSLKARLCVEGKQLLYRYCEERNIAHRKIGKLIVAADETDFEKLRLIDERARRNNVTDLTFLDAMTAASIEPSVKCTGALFSPSTGIIDSHEYMMALQADIEANGGTILLNSEVRPTMLGDDGFEIDVAGDRARCRSLINSAGLDAQRLASSFETAARAAVPERYLAKGHYFSYTGRSPFGHLIYPLPANGGLGIHATNDLSGAARFGPDVTWVDSVDYTFDEDLKEKFVAAIRRYFPAVEAAKLTPAYTGIRPKVVAPGKPAGDFLIQGEEKHGIHGLVNLFGIESPGLTASLAIGEYVKRLL